MRVVVVTPPAPVLDAETVQSRLGLATADPSTLEAYVQAATDDIDGPGGWLGRAIGTQTLELQSHHFPGCACGVLDEDWLAHSFRWGYHAMTVRLPYPEVQSIVSVTYLDGTNTRQTLDPSLYMLSGRQLSPSYGTVWPQALPVPGAIAIRYVAGYTTVPEAIRQALVLAVAQTIALNRPDPTLKQDTVIGIVSQQWDPMLTSAYQTAAERLLSPFRVFL